MADRAEQHRLGAEARFERVLGQPDAFGVDRHAADRVRRERERLTGMLADVFQNPDGFFGDLRANAVAGKQGDLQWHAALSTATPPAAPTASGATSSRMIAAS